MGDKMDDVSDVNPASLAGQVTRLARYGTIALGGYLVGQGVISGDTAELITAIVTTATPMVIGMLIARTTRKKIVAAVENAKSQPNSAE